MSFTFSPIDNSKPIFNTDTNISEQKTDIITDLLYIQEIKTKLKLLDDKIRYYQVHHPHHKDLQKMKLNKKLINKKFLNMK